MALQATLVGERREITLDEDDQGTLDFLEELRGKCPKGVIECREHDNDPALEHRRSDDDRVHGAWLYVRRQSDNVGGTYLLLAHNPQNDPELKSSPCRLRVGKGEGHRVAQDYLWRVTDRAGGSGQTELPVPGARLDFVAKFADITFGVEVQLSSIGAAIAKRRNTIARSAGIPLTWATDLPDPPWNKRRALAQLSTSNIPDRRGRLGTWRIASGLRTFEMQRCRKFSHGCPVGGRGDCGGWHPRWEPVVGHPELELIDGVVEAIGEGRIVHLDTQSGQGAVHTWAAKRDEWVEVFGTPGLVIPQSRERERGGSRPCSYRRVGELPEPRRERKAPRSGVDDAALLDEPGTIRSGWWFVCKGCDRTIASGSIRALRYVGQRREWVCASCAATCSETAS